MISLLADLLSRQDPKQPHSLLTRTIVSLCICLAHIVLHGFYGLCAAIVVYLLGVELLGLPQRWAFYPFFLGLLTGSWKSFRQVRDYWQNYGHGES
jgi:hypothetical protein